MENQKRILNFSEFTKAYVKGDHFSAPGNDEQSVQKLQDGTDSLTSPTIQADSNQMDSVSSGPATKKVKTDYELSPPVPNGPVKMKDVDSKDSEESEEKAEKTEKPVKDLKTTKKKAKKSKEDEREESGEY